MKTKMSKEALLLTCETVGHVKESL